MNINTDYKTENELGLLLRTRRKELGFSQRDLAKKLGVSHANISLWEIGRTGPSLDQIYGWAGALGMTFEVTLKIAPGKEKKESQY